MNDTHHFLLKVMKRILSNWNALRLIVEHGYGSVEDTREICYAAMKSLYSWKNRNFDVDSHLALLLKEHMDEKFLIKLEYQSYHEITKKVENIFKYIKNNEIIKAEEELDKLPPTQSWIHTDINDDSMSVGSKSSNIIEEEDTSEDEEDESSEDESYGCR